MSWILGADLKKALPHGIVWVDVIELEHAGRDGTAAMQSRSFRPAKPAREHRL